MQGSEKERKNIKDCVVESIATEDSWGSILLGTLEEAVWNVPHCPLKGQRKNLSTGSIAH